MTDVTMILPPNLAAALNDSRYVVVITDGRFDAFHTGPEPDLADQYIVAALRELAEALEAAPRSSPDADQETVRPAQADPLHAPGSTPN